ncbi:MAG TPA: HEAT repeat domain-containing protein [Pyrinomonadaceae bacterium]|nr:HEAT repeat domain-containing protein [Pyrinomonadaceae bacterium]
MRFKLLPLACLLAFLASTSSAQDRTALYGRVIGSDHLSDVPRGWTVRVTAKREGTDDILDQRDSAGELYCVRVPANARVRLFFETSYHSPTAKLGYGSSRLPTVIDTSPSDRHDAFRPQPDVIMQKVNVQQGDSARLATQEELQADIVIARETRSVDILGAKLNRYREAYRQDALIMSDLDKMTNTVRENPELKREKTPEFMELLEDLGDIDVLRKGGLQPDVAERVLELVRNEAVFSDLRAQAAYALADYYKSLKPTEVDHGLSGTLEFFRSQTTGSAILMPSLVVLARIGNAADATTIVQSVNGDDPDRALAAIVAIGEGKLVQGAASLVTLLKKDSPQSLKTIVTQSLEELALEKVDVAVAALKDAAISDRHPAVRMEAAEGLGGLTTIYPDTRAVLKEVEKKDASPEVRAAARTSLERKKP